jgi:hypothetical protein
MKPDVHRRFALLAVLLCLQCAAAMLTVRRDPTDRFRAACVSGLVWVALRKVQKEATLRGTAVRLLP